MNGHFSWIGTLLFAAILVALLAVRKALPGGPVMQIAKAGIIVLVVLLLAVFVFNATTVLRK